MRLESTSEEKTSYMIDQFQKDAEKSQRLFYFKVKIFSR